MEIKKRFKLYKSGKNWCMAALMFTGASTGIFMNNVSANADDATATSTDAKTETVTANNNDSQTKEVALPATDAASNNTDSASATTTTSADKETTSTNKDNQNQLSSDWQAVDGGYVYQGSKDVKQNRHYELLPSIKGTGENWYLIDNGKAQSGVQEWTGSYWYFDPMTYLLSQKKDYVKSQWGMYYLVGNDGRIQSGVQEWAGSYWYFDPTTYLLSQKKNYVQSQWGDWYLVGDDGRIQSGVQEWAGSYWYFDPETYLLHKQRGFITSQWGAKYLVGNDGRILSGVQEYDGKIYDIDPTTYQLTKGRNYKQAPNGNWYLFDNGIAQSGIQEWAGNYWYFDPQTYLLRQKRDYVQSQWGSWYLIDDSGRVQSGIQEWAGSYWYFDPQTYLLRQKRDYVQSQWGAWYLIDDSGRVQSGVQEWQGQYWYFNPSTYLLTPNCDIVEHGVKYHVNGSGVVENYVGLPELKQQLPQVIADKLNNNVTYDWTNENNQYRELAVHDMAQLISQGDVENKISVIEQLMYKNNLLTGKVVKSQIFDLAKNPWDKDQLADYFVKGINSDRSKDAIVGVGIDSKKNQLAILLFQPGTNEVAKEVATAPTNPKFMSADETPTSQKTADQVELAYKTGGETGLRYESVKVEPIKGMTDDMVRGVDISSYQSLLNAGVQFYDFNGQPASIFKVLSDAGVNWVRIRLWNDPYDKNGNGYGGGNNDEASLVKMASEAAQYGLKTLVDFHYSDFWADPAKQILPKAWSQLSDTDLAKEVNLYTKKVLADLKRAGADVQMVSIGNEITKGAFGQVANSSKGEDWKSIWLGDAGKRLTMLLSQASSAVRESGNSKIAIHIETPNVDKYRQIMTVLKNNGVDYDYLGTSYYPFWWNNSDTLRDVAHMTETEFGKRLVVMEVSWLNDTHDADGTGNSLSNDGGINKFPIGPQGQVDVLADMYKALVDTDGVGSFYWEPAWLPVHPGYENWQENKDAGNQYGTGWASKYAVGYAPDNEMYWEGKPTWGGTTWDNQSLFDDHGYPLQSLNMYKGFLHGYETPVNTKVSSTVTAKVGTVTDNPLTGVDVNNQTINLTGLISNAGQFLLQGQPNQVISDTQLQAIANELLTSGKSDLQTTANGDVYHLTYELTDANRTAFVKDNHGKHYGDTLNVSYTTQVVVDRQGSATTNQVTSPITVKVSEVWNAVNNYTPTVDGLLAVGDTLTDQDVDLAQINTKTLQTLLTGTKGETVTASYDQIKSLLPGATSALMGTKDYVTADGNHYRYEFWLKDLNQAGLKYGNPLVLSYSASLKWLSKD